MPGKTSVWLSLVLVGTLLGSSQAYALAPARPEPGQSLTALSISFAGNPPGLKPGSGGNLEVPYQASLNLGLAEMTIEAWVKVGIPSHCGPVAGNGLRHSYWFGLCLGKLRFYYPSGTTSPSGVTQTYLDSTTAIPMNTWTHLAATWNGTMARLFINGEPGGERSIANGPLPMPGALLGEPLGIGADINDAFLSDPVYYFAGQIDELRIWSVARREGEIGRWMNQPSPVDYPGLLASWSFDGNIAEGQHGFLTRQNGQLGFAADSPIARGLTLPFRSEVMGLLDGQCERPLEYDPLFTRRVGTVTGSLALSPSAMWVCFTDLPASAWVGVLLDPGGRFSESLGTEEVWVQAGPAGEIRVMRSGENGEYAQAPDLAGKIRAVRGGAEAELRIDNGLFGGVGKRVALAMSLEDDPTGAAFWPEAAQAGTPATWEPVFLPWLLMYFPLQLR